MSHRSLWNSGSRTFLIYFLLTILLTWPLALHFTTCLPHGSGDVWQNLWTFWWWKKALIDLHQSPYETLYMFFPYGTPLIFHDHSAFNMIVSLPINIIFGPVAAYNFAIFLGFSMSGWGAYLLARELTGDARGAFIAGLIFAFFPHHFEQTLEHPHLATIQFLPLIALYTIRVLRLGRWQDAVFLGIVFGLNEISMLYYGVFALLFVPVIVLLELFFNSKATRPYIVNLFVRLGIAGVVAALVMAPFVWPLMREMAAGTPFLKVPENKGVDLVFLFLPSDHHPILGFLTEAYYRSHRSYTAVGFLSYVGYTPLLLSLAALPMVKKERQVVAWILIGLGFLILSLGAHPFVGGEQIRMTFPHAFFESIPLLRTLRVANRFIVMTMLAIAVLSAWGLARLDRKRSWIFQVAVILILFEYLWLPYPTQPVIFSPYFETLATDPEAGAVLDIPFAADWRSQINLAYQTVHGRPIADGYTAAVPRKQIEAILRDPVLSGLFGLYPRVPENIDMDHLRKLGFGTVVLHKNRTSEFLREKSLMLEGASYYERKEFFLERGMPLIIWNTISKLFKEQLGPPLFEDETVRVFRLR